MGFANFPASQATLTHACPSVAYLLSTYCSSPYLSSDLQQLLGDVLGQFWAKWAKFRNLHIGSDKQQFADSTLTFANLISKKSELNNPDYFHYYYYY